VCPKAASAHNSAGYLEYYVNTSGKAVMSTESAESAELDEVILERGVLSKDDLLASRIKFREAAKHVGSNEIGKRAFKELILDILKEDGEITMPEDASLEAAFGIADIDKSGTVEENEFIKVFEKLRDGKVEGLAIHQIVAEGVLTEDDLQRLRREFQNMAQLNRDPGAKDIHSRAITKKQFTKLVKVLMRKGVKSKAATKSQLNAAFQIADNDGSGTIDEEEFIDLYRMIKKGEVKGLTHAKSVPKHFDEFLEKDRIRGELLKKGELSMFKVLVHWNHTLPKDIIYEKFTYVPMIFWAIGYMAVMVSDRIEVIPPCDERENEDLVCKSSDGMRYFVRGMGLLVAILLVSLYQQIFDRYYDIYFVLAQCRTATISFVGMARAYIDNDAIVRALSRYSNVANVTNFIDVTPVYTKANFFDPLTKRHRLLTARERYLIDPKVGKDSRGAVNDIFVWLNATLQLAVEQRYLSTFEKNDLNATLLEQHKALINVWNWVEQPLPFAYMNLVIIVLTFFNCTYGFVKGLQAAEYEIVTLALVDVISVTFTTLCLLRLALNMSTPMSHDDWSLRLATLCQSTIEHSNLMLWSRHKDVVRMAHGHLEEDENFISQDDAMFQMLETYIDKLHLCRTNSGRVFAQRSSTPSLHVPSDDEQVTYDNSTSSEGEEESQHSASTMASTESPSITEEEEEEEEKVEQQEEEEEEEEEEEDEGKDQETEEKEEKKVEREEENQEKEADDRRLSL
jgi:Ca2+-binding EF-hand superfamily protein